MGIWNVGLDKQYKNVKEVDEELESGKLCFRVKRLICKLKIILIKDKIISLLNKREDKIVVTLL
jgi:hypothetical protein